ncbi:MAG: peptidylprolyl isomerase [Oryzomonas sp.]|nr:peptidylprolyl isomerase [Oryzomonas sp.]MDR3580772.1 peptidylprolyl isomerase [Oryzomonas sp.]
MREKTTNKEYTMARAAARHILVASKEVCEDLKKQIEAGADFAAVAREHSLCPSGKQGGALGEFGPGQMVKEFDQVVFSGEVGKVLGPVQTQFGYHLLEVTSRTE